MHSSYAAVFRLSPPLVAHSHTCLAIRSGQSHPGFQTQPQPVRRRCRVISSLSRDPTTRSLWAGPSRPWLPLERRRLPSCGVVKHLFSRTSTSGASGTNVSCDRDPSGPSSTKGRIKAESERSRQARGVPGVARCQTVRAWFGHESSRFAMPHHFWWFWRAISEPGWTSRKKVPLGIRLKSTRPSHGRV